MHFRVSGAKLDAWETTGKNKDTGTDLIKFPNASVLILLSSSRKGLDITGIEGVSKKEAEAAMGELGETSPRMRIQEGFPGDAVRSREESLSRCNSSAVRAQGTAGGAGEVPGRARK